MTAYVLVLFGATWALRHYEPQGAALVVLSILPALPIIAVIGVMGLYLIEEKDEYVRARLVTAMLGGLAIMLSITSAWGFMEEAGVLPHMPAYFAFILWCAGMGLTQCFMALRDRRAGGEGE
ncbi:hypothetical protein [Sphingomonas soli]|uniref:hypothetical protein n=1 Tax=Sphingomonas soli TaxID=266127 RepID=UPI001FE0EF96|nr:hypothetical protein [Sphingomonas soli]